MTKIFLYSSSGRQLGTIPADVIAADPTLLEAGVIEWEQAAFVLSYKVAGEDAFVFTEVLAYGIADEAVIACS